MQPWQADSRSCVLSHSVCLPLGCGDFQPLLWVGAPGLGLPNSDTEPPGSVENTGAVPEPGWGQRAAGGGR